MYKYEWRENDEQTKPLCVCVCVCVCMFREGTHMSIFAGNIKSDKYACNSRLPINELSWPTPSLPLQTVSMETVKRIFTMQLIPTLPCSCGSPYSTTFTHCCAANSPFKWVELPPLPPTPSDPPPQFKIDNTHSHCMSLTFTLTNCGISVKRKKKERQKLHYKNYSYSATCTNGNKMAEQKLCLKEHGIFSQEVAAPL